MEIAIVILFVGVIVIGVCLNLDMEDYVKHKDESYNTLLQIKTKVAIDKETNKKENQKATEINNFFNEINRNK